jgi:hypothetical protein
MNHIKLLHWKYSYLLVVIITISLRWFFFVSNEYCHVITLKILDIVTCCGIVSWTDFLNANMGLYGGWDLAVNAVNGCFSIKGKAKSRAHVLVIYIVRLQCTYDETIQWILYPWSMVQAAFQALKFIPLYSCLSHLARFQTGQLGTPLRRTRYWWHKAHFLRQFVTNLSDIRKIVL